MTKTKYSQTFKNKLRKQLEAYIEENEYPAIVKFCAKQGIAEGTMYAFEDLEESRKKAKTKCHAYLLDKLLSDKGNPMKYMFILNSNYGYKDSETQDKPTQINTINFIGDSKQAQQYISELKRKNKIENTTSKNVKSRK